MEKMRSMLMGSAILALMALGAVAPSFVADFGVRASLPWQGWMNANPPLYGFFYGGYWDYPILPASFSGDILTLAPNTNVTSDWSLPPGSSNLDAVLFVEDHTLAGQSVTFSGVVLFNTLASPYVAYAFVRDFVTPAYSFEESKVPLVGGQRFSVTHTIGPSSEHFVEVGFETIGPNADPVGVALLGSVQVAPADPGILFPKLLADVTGVGPGSSLADKVEVAQLHYAGTDVEASCGVLTGFIKQVRAQQDKKVTPTMLANQLTSEARAVMAVIGCK
jgi:hypothetical protein